MSSLGLSFINREENRMTKIEDQNSTPATSGIILHGARFYDILAWVMMFGRERAFREKLIDLARLKPGDTVLDVGCGTGTLAITAKRRVGPTGKVYGIDPSPEMIARSGQKARKAGLDIVFKNGAIEALPFSNAQFDAVLSTLMFHHLPHKLREAGAREIRRVLKPGSRVLVVDFGGTEQQRGLLARLHQRHGHVKLPVVIGLLGAAGLNVVESGVVGVKDLHFTLATAPCCEQ